MNISIQTSQGRVLELDGGGVHVLESELPLAFLASAPPHWPPNCPGWRDGAIWKWSPFARKGKDDFRRFGTFAVRFPGNFPAEVKIELLPDLSLTSDEYFGMVDELRLMLGRSIWDRSDTSISSRVVKSARVRDPIEIACQWIETLEATNLAFRALASRPASDLGPPRPDVRNQLGRVAGSNYLLPENAVALAWAQKASAHLVRHHSVVVGVLEEISELESSKSHKEGIAALRRLELRQRALMTGLSSNIRAFRRICPSANWSPTPAVMRSRLPRRFAAEIAALDDEPMSEAPSRDSILMAALVPQLAAFVFEAWVGLHVSRVLQALGFKILTDPVRQGSSLLGIPHSSTWRFTRGGTELTWIHGPVGSTWSPSLSWENEIFMTKGERAGYRAAGSGARCRFSCGSDANTPDYALVLREGGRTAWLVGDACLSEQSRSVAEKASTVRQYWRDLRWIDAEGGVIEGCLATSFVAVPALFEKVNASEVEKVEGIGVQIVRFAYGDVRDSEQFIARALETMLRRVRGA